MHLKSKALLVLGLAAAVSRPARAADRFHNLPGPQPGHPSELLIRIVEYAGSSNGVITVDVKNPTDRPLEFSARGLYFVPQGDANTAPQRLGAVGPFQQQTANGAVRHERLVIAPGHTERLVLDVYCFDSHRASPGSGTAFRVAKDRVPEGLTRAIDVDARRSAAPAAVQSEVWRHRDEKWIPLDGEGRQEADKR